MGELLIGFHRAMKRAPRVCSCITVLSTTFLVMHVYFHYYQLLKSIIRLLPRTLSAVASTSTTGKNLIYFIQTESCLSSYLVQRSTFGSGSSRQVVVLRWKSSCSRSKAKRFKHIQYIHRRGTTWSEGRNLLYRFAKSLSREYLYYIFLDNYLKFYFPSGSVKYRYLTRGIRPPLDAFEDFLRTYEPAASVPMHCSLCIRRNKISEKLKRLCCHGMKQLKPFPDYLPVTIHFHAFFNTFHREAIGLILPYRLDYESNSWWESQTFVILASDIIFHGQVPRVSPITVINVNHREYPKLELDNWRAIFDSLKVQFPQSYRNQMVFTPNIEIIPLVKDNVLFTPWSNITVPLTKTSILPFKHFH